MSSSMCPHRAVLLLLLVMLSWSRLSLAFPFSASVDASGDEPELIFPTAGATHVASPSPSPLPSITTTFIRIKDFLFNQVVDVLRDNLLLIIVVTSLLIVIVFIVCCASALSHRRKLEAYYTPRKVAPRKYVSGERKGVERRPQQQQQQQGARPGPGPQGSASGSASCLRTPSKALVGEKEGKEPQVKAREVEQQQKEDKKKGEEPKPGTSAGGTSQAPVCTCHLRKACSPAQ